jgi:membrane carboxypeptidase/penicillin-binding protein PbpC
MTIEAIGRFNGLYVGGVYDEDLAAALFKQIKDTIEEDNAEFDPKIKVSYIGLTCPPKMIGMGGGAYLDIEISIVTYLKHVKIRDFDYPWDSLIQKGYQTNNDYTYDEEFFHNFRNDAERDCGEV